MMPYILHVAVILAGCLVFYRLLLQKETFFKLNRWVLLCCLAIAFGLPFVQVPQQWSFRKAAVVVTNTNEHLPAVGVVNASATPSVQPAVQPQDGWQWSTVVTWIGWLYWFGVIVFAGNFLIQLCVLFYRAYRLPVIRDGRFRIVELNGDQAPCSFGNNIYINPAKYDWDTYNQIILHEKEHIRQGHTLDLLLAELVLILQWFNPFAWLYRKEIEKNLEFLTDDQLLHHADIEMEAYQLSLVKVTAPNLPLSITTNYNQSLLKKRVAMMNAKRSNVHTSWKYFFLLPVLVLFVCLLNEPVANAQPAPEKTVVGKPGPHKPMEPVKVVTGKPGPQHKGITTEGVWFGVIKNDKVTFQFKSDADEHASNSTTFLLSELGNLPREQAGTFSISRDAGSIQFTGKFDGNNGMGKYVFKPNESYAEAMRKHGVVFEKESDQMVYFMVNVLKSYPAMLKDNGYSDFNRQHLVPLAALKIDAAYIQLLKKSGLKPSLQDLIPLKSLGVDAAYVDEVRKAGYPDVSAHQLITFKSQGINGKYIADMKKTDANVSEHDLVAMKSLDVDDAYIESLADVGYAHVRKHQLIAMKAQNITAAYIKSFLEAGYTEVEPNDFVALKAQGITADYLKGFGNVGYKRLGIHEAISFKAMGITPEYVKGIESLGLGSVSQQDIISMKAQNITPALVKEYQGLGLGDITLHEVVSAKATGTSPAFIKAMKDKGHDLKSIQKYIQLRTVVE